VDHPHGWLEPHWPDFFLNAPRHITVFVCRMRKQAIEPTDGHKGFPSVGDIAREETPSVMIFDRVFVDG
jgi:hypothetical protein